MKQLKVHMLCWCSVSETAFCTRLSQFGSNTRWNRQEYLCDDFRSTSSCNWYKASYFAVARLLVRSFVRFFFLRVRACFTRCLHDRVRPFVYSCVWLVMLFLLLGFDFFIGLLLINLSLLELAVPASPQEAWSSYAWVRGCYKKLQGLWGRLQGIWGTVLHPWTYICFVPFVTEIFYFIASLPIFFVDSKGLLSTVQCFHLEAIPENSPLQVPSRK